MAWAIQQQVVKSPAGRHVLLCLANYAGADGTAAFPAVARLSADTGYSIRTVKAALQSLQDLGLIRRGRQQIAGAYISRADRRPVVYDLMMPLPGHEVQEMHPAVTERDAADGNGVQMTTERGAGVAPKPLVNPSKTTTTQGLIWPSRLDTASVVVVDRLIQGMDQELQQQVLDELEGKLSSQSPPRQPMAWFREVVARARRGEFIPDLGIPVRQARERELARHAKERERIAADAEAARRRNTPEARAKAFANIAEIKQLIRPATAGD